MYVCCSLNTLCLTSAGSQSSSSCTCFMCYYSTASPTKTVKTKETTFFFMQSTQAKTRTSSKIFLCLLATTTFQFSLLYTSFVFIVNMKEQQSNLLECFACIYAVRYIYETLWKTWTSETCETRRGRRNSDGIYDTFWYTKSKSAKAVLTPFHVQFLSSLCRYICMAYVMIKFERGQT